jgi:ElaB/YqjD/DUF883 family membrane-anchored ribosome-binding protein
MDPRKLKLMLLPFQGYHAPHEDGEDLGGDTAVDDGRDDDPVELESDDEDKADNEEQDDAKTEPEEEKPEAKPAHIPKSRFDEVLSQRNTERERAADLERQLAELKSAKTEAKPEAKTEQAPDISTMERQYIKLLMEGSEDEAAELRAKINNTLLSQAEERVESRQTQRQVASDLQRESDAVISDYPYLDTADGEDALGLIVAKRDAYIASGMKPAEALRKAADLIAPRFKPDDGDDEKPAPKADVPEDTRTQEAIKRGMKDSASQPPNMTGVSNRSMDSVKRDVSKMTEEEFDALPPEEVKRLKGM